MKILRIITASVLLLTAWTFSAFAAQDSMTDAQRHFAWTSCVISSQDGDFVRLYTMAQNDEDVSLVLDFLPGEGFFMSIFVGKRQISGKQVLKDGPYDKEVQLRIDKGDIFASTGHITEDADCVYIDINSKDLNNDFVRQLEKGNFLRIMVFDVDQGVARYSLKGFTQAYARAMYLLVGLMPSEENDDLSFFHPQDETKKEPDDAPPVHLDKDGTVL